MRKIIKDYLWILFLFIIGFNDINAQSNFLTLNGKKIEISVSGFENNKDGKPVIVFENGRGSTLDSWDSVVNVISKDYVTFRYNRPRLGKSEDDSILPTMKYIIDLERKMLLEKNLKPPYLLVGHSFGASYIRSFASYYPDEIAGLIFVDPGDFTKKRGMGRLPYVQYGLPKHQIDSLFEAMEQFGQDFLKTCPKTIAPEVKVSFDLTDTDYEECVRNPIPDVPVHFIQAGGYGKGGDVPSVISDTERLFRISSDLQRNRWMELLYPLTYGRFFYTKCSGHCVQCGDPYLVISSIKIALLDFEKMKLKK